MPLSRKRYQCGASVAEARKLAAIPRRPAWRDSDPRWRRRVLAGVWVLVLLPLVDVLHLVGWARRVPIPDILPFRDPHHSLEETFLYSLRVDQPLFFCIGVVLLFAKERGRLRGRLDWTRRWGVSSVATSCRCSAPCPSSSSPPWCRWASARSS